MIEVNDEIHRFFPRDQWHLDCKAIYAKLDTLNSQLKEQGYMFLIQNQCSMMWMKKIRNLYFVVKIYVIFLWDYSQNDQCVLAQFPKHLVHNSYKLAILQFTDIMIHTL